MKLFYPTGKWRGTSSTSFSQPILRCSEVTDILKSSMILKKDAGQTRYRKHPAICLQAVEQLERI